jgi:vacuolar-type H+-ATPase subunit I/STV1
MTKVLLILSIVLMAAAGFFAYNIGRDFAGVRQEAYSIHNQTKVVLDDVSKVVADIGGKNAEIATVTQEVEVEAEKLKNHKLKLAQIDGEMKRLEDSIKSKNDTMAELKVKLSKFPPGFSAETMTEDLNKTKQAIVELQNAAEMKKKEVEGESEKLDAASKALSDIISKIESRKKAFERNSLTGRIIAVNNDWGFVVLDIGERETISPDTKLIMIRGTATVGKLSILSVQGQRTVASVLTETLAPGMSPAPGDQVILENLNQ